jgi:serine/threonine protein kinase/Flp pilus assembly protein TadD
VSVKCPKCHSENPETKQYCADCGTQLSFQSKEIYPGGTETLQAPVKELTTGSTFAGRYQIIEELGKGGMGRVYKVFDTDIKEKVALKLLKPEIAADRETIERFSNELRFARKISHRNVCRMYDLGKAEGTQFITMEYVSGEDLKSMIRMSTGLTVGTMLSIGKQVCDGLAEAHSLGVVHRDLKPQNIMIDKGGNAKIMDFGIARSVREKGITGPSVLIGTPEYMSPEQAEAKEVDYRSDIYSLGVILYEMATGRVPFEGDTALSIAMKHKGETPRSPGEINPSLPESLNRLILKCLEKNKAERYQSAAEVRSELAKIEEGIPTTEKAIPKRKPFTSKEITVTFRLKKLLIPGSIAAFLMVAAVLIWQLLPKKEVAPVPLDKPSLAIMYFKNNTGDQNLDHWRTALSDLLIADLTQSKYIGVMSGDRLFDILRQLDLLEARTYSREELKKVASRGGASHILLGDFSRAGENFRINIVLQTADTGEVVGSESVDGQKEESLISMVDMLTKRIKADFKLSKEEIAADIDREVGKITTSSTQAYQYYDEGRNLHHRGEYRESIQLMEKALAVDPGFAMAYRSMAVSYSNLLMFSEAKKYIRKAFELRDRLSDRERYLIEGEFFRNTEMTYDQAIEAYTKLLKLYPDDTIANTNLGILYADLEEWDKAISQYGEQIGRRDKSSFPYINQSEAYMAKGMYDKAKEVLELHIDRFGDSAPLREGLAMNYFFQGKYDLALDETRKALVLNPDDIMAVIQEGIILLGRGDLAEAERTFLQVLDKEEPGYHLYIRVVYGTLNLLKGRMTDGKSQYEKGLELAGRLEDNWWKAVFQTWLAYSYLRSGKPEEALKVSESAWDVAQGVNQEQRWRRRALLFQGLSYIEMKSPGAAQKTADELKKLIDEGMNKKEIRLYDYLQGMIELQKKNFSGAIEHLERAVSLLPFTSGLEPCICDQGWFTESLALAYYRAGDNERAQKEYEDILSISTGKLYWGDVYPRSIYMLGKIYEEQGNKSKAVEHFQKFLELWKDADPGLPEVEDAGKRLAVLKGA